MTDLKQKLGAKWINMTGHSGLPEEYDDFVSLLITILVQQREALKRIAEIDKKYIDEPKHYKEIDAEHALAATDEALKGLGIL